MNVFFSHIFDLPCHSFSSYHAYQHIKQQISLDNNQFFTLLIFSHNLRNIIVSECETNFWELFNKAYFNHPQRAERRRRVAR